MEVWLRPCGCTELDELRSACMLINNVRGLIISVAEAASAELGHGWSNVGYRVAAHLHVFYADHVEYVSDAAEIVDASTSWFLRFAGYTLLWSSYVILVKSIESAAKPSVMAALRCFTDAELL